MKPTHKSRGKLALTVAVVREYREKETNDTIVEYDMGNGVIVKRDAYDFHRLYEIIR